MKSYLGQSENYHAKSVELKMEQLLPHIPISLDMVRVEELKQMIGLLPPYALGVIRKSTKDRNSTNPKGLRTGRVHLRKPLLNFLKGAF
jgi:hypothetical protein